MYETNQGDGAVSRSRHWVEIAARLGDGVRGTLQFERLAGGDGEATVRYRFEESGQVFRISALEASLDAVRSGFPVELETEPGDSGGFVSAMRIQPGPNRAEADFYLQPWDGSQGWTIRIDDLEDALARLEDDVA